MRTWLSAGGEQRVPGLRDLPTSSRALLMMAPEGLLWCARGLRRWSRKLLLDECQGHFVFFRSLGQIHVRGKRAGVGASQVCSPGKNWLVFRAVGPRSASRADGGARGAGYGVSGCRGNLKGALSRVRSWPDDLAAACAPPRLGADDPGRVVKRRAGFQEARGLQPCFVFAFLNGNWGCARGGRLG